MDFILTIRPPYHHRHHLLFPSPTTFRPNILEIGPSCINLLLLVRLDVASLPIFVLTATCRGSCVGDSRINFDNHHHLPLLLMNHDRNGCSIPSDMMEFMEFLAGARNYFLFKDRRETCKCTSLVVSTLFFPLPVTHLAFERIPVTGVFLSFFCLGYTRMDDLLCCWLR